MYTSARFCDETLLHPPAVLDIGANSVQTVFVCLYKSSYAHIHMYMCMCIRTQTRDFVHETLVDFPTVLVNRRAVCLCGGFCGVFDATDVATLALHALCLMRYGVATISRLLKIISLFCKRAL